MIMVAMLVTDGARPHTLPAIGLENSWVGETTEKKDCTRSNFIKKIL